MSIKQHDVEQTISHRRNQKKQFKNSIILKQNQKHSVPKLIGCRKSNYLEQQIPTLKKKLRPQISNLTWHLGGTRKKRKNKAAEIKGIKEHQCRDK